MASRCEPCRKVVFDNPIGAALRNSIRYGIGFRPYPCPHGNGWHLTTKPFRTEATANG